MAEPLLTGLIPPMVTPLAGDDELDHPGLERLIDHLIEGQVDGLFLLGTCGEGPALSSRLKVALVEATSERVANRVPMLVCLTDASMTESLALADNAHAAGAAAVVAAPPPYYPMSETEVISYFQTLADRLPLPLVLYNMPSHVKTLLSIRSVVELSRHPNIIGLKDSGGDLTYFEQLAKALRTDADRLANPFPLLIGPEERIVDAFRVGASGAVAGGANIYPSLYALLVGLVAEQQWERAETFQQVVTGLGESIFSVSSSPSRVVIGLKGALAGLGICSGRVNPTFRSLTDDEQQTLTTRLREYLSQLETLDSVQA